MDNLLKFLWKHQKDKNESWDKIKYFLGGKIWFSKDIKLLIIKKILLLKRVTVNKKKILKHQ